MKFTTHQQITARKMKSKKRFGTLKKLLEIEEAPRRIQIRPKRQRQRVIAKKPRQSESYKRRFAQMHDPQQVEVTLSVMQRAEAVKENLDAKFPSFMKPMIRSNVTKGFWLSLPKLFCHLHLPSHDTTMFLEDEYRREFSTKYLAERRGLSAGWMGFSIAHNLVEGDVLVFHMVRHNKLKVYIIRSSDLDEVDAALCLLHFDEHTKQMESGHGRFDCRGLKPAGVNHLKSVPQNFGHKGMANNNIVQLMDYPQRIGFDLQLALEGLIYETCSIGNAVKARNIKPFTNDFAMWNKRMVDYEQMLSNLGQIHAQVEQLLQLVLEPKLFYSKGYRGVVYVQNQDTDTRTAEVRMLELKERVERLYSEIEVLKTNAEMHKFKH